MVEKRKQCRSPVLLQSRVGTTGTEQVCGNHLLVLKRQAPADDAVGLPLKCGGSPNEPIRTLLSATPKHDPIWCGTALNQDIWNVYEEWLAEYKPLSTVRAGVAELFRLSLDEVITAIKALPLNDTLLYSSTHSGSNVGLFHFLFTC